MEITRQQSGDWVELHVKGRLDSYWSTDFKKTIDDLVRAGTHHIRVNLSEVSYLSSAGLGVLISSHKQLMVIRGQFEIVNPSAAVKEVLALTKVDALLKTSAAPVRPADASVARTALHYTRDNLSFTVFHLEEGRFACRLIGDPELLHGCRFSQESCRKVQFPAKTLAVGLGALGNDFNDCQGRFGEFLAAAGAAAYLPTDGTNVPDYMLAAGASIPELQVCYAVACEGPLSRQVRFEAEAETGAVPLSNILHACLELTKAERIGFVLLAETAGLLGAALKRSPDVASSAGASKPANGAGAAVAAGPDLFAFPQVRDWLSFTAERAYPHSVALVTGVAAKGDGGPLAQFVRPLGGKDLVGHCHAAAFSYRPLSRGEIDLHDSVASLFENLTFQGILHLLADTRPIAGLGESEFLRGACWFSPIGDVLENR
jgi:anti-anti-sigma factor